jgi:arylsulfatase A-like enzyme
MVTGRLPIRNGLCGNDKGGQGVFSCSASHGLPQNETTFATLLKNSGKNYRTGMLGKWHLGQKWEFMPFEHGFDYYLGVPYSVDMGLAYGNTSAESDFESPEKGGYYGCNPLPLVENNTILEQPTDLTNLTARYTAAASKFITSAVDDKKAFLLYMAFGHVHTPQYAGASQAGKSKRGVFGDSVEELDAAVGTIMGTVKSLGIDQNTGTPPLQSKPASDRPYCLYCAPPRFRTSWSSATAITLPPPSSPPSPPVTLHGQVVFFTSDNGAPDAHQHNPGWQPLSLAPHGSNGPFLGGKTSTWEGGLREPGIVWGPGLGIKAGQRNLAHVSTLDIFATIMEMASVPMPKDRIYDSHSMLPLLTNRPSTFTAARETHFFYQVSCARAPNPSPSHGVFWSLFRGARFTQCDMVYTRSTTSRRHRRR